MHIIEHKNRAAAKPYKDTVIFKHGTQKLRLRVRADPFAALCQMDTALDTMRKAETKIKANPADAEAQEEYGGAVLDFFAAVFGEDQTLAIVDFYKGVPGFMLRDVKRYIIGTALPKIKKLAAKQSRRA